MGRLGARANSLAGPDVSGKVWPHETTRAKG